jgi:phage N-6-adenine-methyltransferase
MNDEGQKTPKWLFDKIEAIVEQITGRKFALDAAASPWNAQCGNYFTRDQDSLKQDWTAYKNIFLNAPFAKDEIGPFVWKAIASKAGCTVALLVPVWTSYEWCVELKKIGQYHDIVGLVFFELFSGKRIVRNKGDKQIQVAIIGPNVKPGNGPAIYAAPPPKNESPELQISLNSHDGSQTPRWLFEKIQEIVGRPFQVDAAASQWNAQCDTFLDEETNALIQDWTQWKTIFVNAPFSATLIAEFVAKAIEAAATGSTVAMILPFWAGYSWFQSVKRKGRLHDVIGPVSFTNHDGSHTVLNNGRSTSSIGVAFLGPDVVAGTNGEPIRKPDGSSVEPGTNGSSQARSESIGSIRHGLRLIPLSSVEPKPTTWLWHRRIPLGELTICDGDPADNKSSLLIDIAARVSTGRPMPDGSEGVLGNVLLLSAEDSLEKTIRKRLEVAEADLARIKTIEGEVSLPGTHKALEQAIRMAEARLIIVDPLMAFLSADANGDQKVRKALGPLKKIAERTNSAIVMVRHLAKRGSKHAMYRGSGSIAIIGASRSAFLVGRSPNDPGFRVLCHVKSNLGPLTPSLLFEPVDVDGEVAIEWRGETELSANYLLTSGPPEDRLGEAMAFLTELLRERPMAQQEIRRRAIAAGIALRTLERAKEMLGVVSARTGFGPGSVCSWQMPDAEIDS